MLSLPSQLSLPPNKRIVPYENTIRYGEEGYGKTFSFHKKRLTSFGLNCRLSYQSSSVGGATPLCIRLDSMVIFILKTEYSGYTWDLRIMENVSNYLDIVCL
jgi:hypothetical protein